MTNEVGRPRSEEVQSKTGLNSVLILLILAAIVALVGWMAWVVINALAPVVGVLCLIFFVMFNIWFVFKTKRSIYSAEEKQKSFVQNSLDKFNEKVLEKGKTPWSKEEVTGIIMAFSFFAMLLCVSEVVLLIIYAGQEQFQYLPLNYLGLAAIAASTYFVFSGLKRIPRIFGDDHYCRDTSRTRWIVIKTLNLIIAFYIGGILLTVLGVV